MNVLIPSLYPRSEELIKKTRDFDRNRIDEQELEKYFYKDFIDFINLQNELSLKYYNPGLFKFKDLLRPFTLVLKNSIANTLIRFEETNTFWRKVEISNFDLNYNNFEIIFRDYLYLDFFNKTNNKDLINKKILITLPSVFTFYKYSNLSFEQINFLLLEFCKNLNSYLVNIKLSKENISIVLVEYLDFSYSKDFELFKQNFEYLKKLLNELNKEDLELFYFTYSNLNKVYLDIFSLEVKGISINFYRNNLRDIDFSKLSKYLLAGVISTESSLLEIQERINNFLNNISNYFDLNKMIFTIDFIPYLLPRSIMDYKLKNMIDILNKQELIKTN
jgi:methionine synthase II (cobalamin-independent)